MKICYLDAFSGISGDMTVGALVDAGADWSALEEALKSLNLEASFRLEKTKRRGMAASKFYVDAADDKKHRHLPHIEKIIGAGALSERSRKNALSVFQNLGEAEARSHAVPIEKVHFHEVGAVDSICDIVGACVALGLTRRRGGLLLADQRRQRNGEHAAWRSPRSCAGDCRAFERPARFTRQGPEAELTTPTGAALATTLAKEFGPLPAVRLLAQGFGAGDKDFPARANVLRVLIGERTRATETTSVKVLEANIDDSTPQVLGYAMERLLEAGALDVTLAPVFMKKNRPASQISVICAPNLAERLSQILFAETSTLGVRIFDAERRVLARNIQEVETPHGRVRIKYTDLGSFAPEYDDCRRIAEEQHLPLREVIAEATRAFEHGRS